jgi:Na+/proline symporter
MVDKIVILSAIIVAIIVCSPLYIFYLIPPPDVGWYVFMGIEGLTFFGWAVFLELYKPKNGVKKAKKLT